MAGYAYTTINGITSYNFAIARYTTSGSLDVSFGTGGLVTTDFSGSNDFANSVAIDANGRIIVAGSSFILMGPSKFVIARYITSIDPSYTKPLLSFICFREGSRILCLNEDTYDEEYRKIETISPGAYVKTYLHGYVPVHRSGHRTIDNPGHNDRIANRLYKLSTN